MWTTGPRGCPASWMSRDVPRDSCFRGSWHGWVLLRWQGGDAASFCLLCPVSGCRVLDEQELLASVMPRLCVPWGIPGLSPHERQHLGRFHQPPPGHPLLVFSEVGYGAGQAVTLLAPVLTPGAGGGADLPGKGQSPRSRMAGRLSAAASRFPSAASRFSVALGFGSADVFPFQLRQSSRGTNMLLPLFPTHLPNFAALVPTTHTAPSSGSNCSSPFGIAVTAKGSEQQNAPPWGSRAQRDQLEVCEHAVSERLFPSDK